MFNSTIIRDSPYMNKFLLIFNMHPVGHPTRRLFMGLFVEEVVRDLSDQFDAEHDLPFYMTKLIDCV